LVDRKKKRKSVRTACSQYGRMEPRQAFFLNIGHSSGTLSCKVHPVVILSVFDQYVRRNEGQNRVIGTLTGINNDGVVEIINSFAVPHTEGAQFVYDTTYLRNMHELHLKTNPQESVVGWYSTGTTIDEDSVRVHEFYWKEMQAPPIHLLVDIGLTNNKLSMNAYVGSLLSSVSQDHNFGFQFKPVTLDFDVQKPEKIAMDVLLKAQTKKGVLMHDLDNLEISLQRLVSLLDILTDYVQRVLKGEETANAEVGRLLAETMATVPKIDSPAFQKMFSKSMKDLLMVVYLANLTQTQLKISDTFNKCL